MMDVYEQKRKIFEAAEEALDFKLNAFLKDVLIIHGFDSAFIISKITEEDIDNFENFTQNELPQYLSFEQQREFYGIYFKEPKRFKIFAGLRKQIIFIAQYYKSKLNITENKSVATQTDEPPIQPGTQIRQIKQQFLANNSGNRNSDSVMSDVMPNINEQSSEEQLILNNLRKWFRTKVSENIWAKLESQMKQITAEVKLPSEIYPFLEPHCNVTCFCGQIYKILKVAKSERCKPRWIYSNIQKHFTTKHIMNNNPSKRKLECQSTGQPSVKQFLIEADKETDVVSYLPNNKEKQKKIIILKNIALSPITNKIDDLKNDVTTSINNEINCSTESLPKLNIIAINEEPVVVSKINAKPRERSVGKLDIDISQSLITDFYPVLKGIYEVLHERSESILNLSQNIVKLTEDNDKFQGSTLEKTNSLIEVLYKKSIENSHKSKHSNSFDEVIKKFSLYLYYIGGRLLYEVLQSNLQNSLPAITTLNRYVTNQKKHFDEGHFDFVGLKTYLEERNLPPYVWIGEDATRISGKIEYNAKNNKVMGFVLPLKDGVPETETYKAKTASCIQNFFSKSKKSNYAHAIMAQPLSASSSAICLSLFGTDNCYDFKSVLSRWTYLKNEGEKYGIKIVGFSSDGDTRYLKAMRMASNLSNHKATKWPWFHIEINTSECYVQDTVHIGTKLRNRLLKRNVTFPIGKYNITIDHLIMLIEKYDKSQHFLTISDINPDDRMNFKSVLKIIDFEVQKLLANHPECRVTCNYLKMISYILSSYLEKELSIEKRIYNIWYAVFFLRIWRTWVKSSEVHNVRDNFISDNAYLCVELNAHFLVKLIVMFRENNLQQDMFCPWLYGSQCCENIFRCTRSLTSTFATVVNFSIKDIIQRIGKIKIINEVIFDLQDTIKFPREEKREKRILRETESETLVDFTKYTDKAIECVMENALNNARKDLSELGISEYTEDFWMQVAIEMKQENTRENMIDDDEDDKINTQVEEINENNNLFDDTILDEDKHANEFNVKNEIENVGDNIKLKDYSNKVKTINEESPFLRVKIGTQEKEVVIKKSTYCWLLEEGNGRVSTDRLRRFYTQLSKKTPRKNLDKKKKGNLNKKEKCSGKGVASSSKKEKAEKKDVVYEDEVSTESSSEDNDVVYDDSTDSEEFSERSDDDKNDNVTVDKKNKDITLDIPIQLEQYYAVYYDELWAIGRAISKVTTSNEENVEKKNMIYFKFLKCELDNYVWPLRPDNANVEHKYIIYGPLNLIGNGPFQLKRQDIININKKYKLCRSTL